MTKTLLGARFLAAVACLSIPTAALAQECSRQAGTVEYCECIYGQALQRIMDSQGTSQTSIAQRIKALAKSLKKCLIDGGTDEVTTEIQKI
jgi:hypothetical protein